MMDTYPKTRTLTPVKPEFEHLIAPGALDFIADLHRRFSPERQRCLYRREKRLADLKAGVMFDFLPETAHIREPEWKVAPAPADLQDRRVEITGPASSRKMVINALNSGANVFMADAEDSESPTWDNILNGQLNLYDAVRRTITFETPEKKYQLNDRTAVLMFRPRGWHLTENHFIVDGEPVSASLFDFGIYFYHNAKELLSRGSGPYFYLPKLESHLEARLWNDVFTYSQEKLGIPHGSIRATVLVETLPAAFEMDEILWELRDHSAGLNCGRWDYIFSFIKKLGHDRAFVLPDRASVTMDKAFLAAYVALLIRTCHRRGIHAMGGMAAQIPSKDPAVNAAATEKVTDDKYREVLAGHDGTWVAHPGLVKLAKDIFDKHMPGPNQLDHPGQARSVTAKDLLEVPEGAVTEAGLRANLRVGIQYLEPWLRGTGCVPINNLMEDAATAEISRTQVWQWLSHGAKLDDGRTVDAPLVFMLILDELASICKQVGEETFYGGRYAEAVTLFGRLLAAPECPGFLTIPAYDMLLELEGQ